MPARVAQFRDDSVGRRSKPKQEEHSMAASNGSNRTAILLATFVLLAAAALTAPGLLIAQNQPQGGGMGAGMGGGMGAGPTTRGAAPARVQPSMQTMGRGFRGIRGGVGDATKNDATLGLLADFERDALVAKNGVPAMVANMPEADRPARIAAYKKEMIKLIRQALDAEEALLAGDNAKATEAVNAMNATQTEGHGEFRPRRGAGPRGGGEGGARRGE
jgi:hypothetical protein